jgi:hypothetical protein
MIFKYYDINLYKFPRSVVAKYYISGVLTQQKFIVLQFWRPEIINQGVNRAVCLLKPVGKDFSLPLIAWGVCQQSSVFLNFWQQHFSFSLCHTQLSSLYMSGSSVFPLLFLLGHHSHWIKGFP